MLRPLLLALLGTVLLASEWRPAAIGSAEGTSQVDGADLVLDGRAGWGVAHDLPAGDCTIILRFTAISGTIQVALQADGAARNEFSFAPRTDEVISAERPRYVRAIVSNRRVAYWIGSDGVRWLNRMGGFRLDGEAAPVLRLGFTGAGSARVAVTITAGAQLENRTDWFGNSLPGSVRDTVNFNMLALAVAPDGSCLVTSNFEEQGHSVALYRDGRQIAPDHKTPSAGRAAAIHGDSAWAAVGGSVQRFDLTLRPQGRPASIPGAAAGVHGLACDGSDLFASTRDGITVMDPMSLSVKRTLPVAQAGALAISPAGTLWAVIEPYDDIFRIPYAKPGYVVEIDRTTGAELRRIADLSVPTALCFDRTGRLLVAENGQDQQVRIYDVRQAPTLVRSVGRPGGMPGDGGIVRDLSFNGITGIGCDAAGNLYVSQTGWPFRYVMGGMMANTTRLIAIPAACLDGTEAAALWKLESNSYIFDGATLDPRDPTSAYAGADQRYRIDWSASGQIGQWVGSLIDHRRFPDEGLVRRTRSTPFLRRIGEDRFLYLVGSPGIVVYRFEKDREFAIPCAAICASAEKQHESWLAACPAKQREPYVWNDADGDGLAEAGEFTVLPVGKSGVGFRWMPDARGDIWQTTYGSTEVVRWKASVTAGRASFARAESITIAEPFERVEWAHYEPETDVMVVAGAHRDYPGIDDARVQTTCIARFSAWLSGKPKLESWFPFHDGDNGFQDPAMGFCVLGDLAYVGSRPGNIHVYDLRRGNRVIELTAGPMVYGCAGYFDRDQSSVQAFALPGGEQVALCQENGWCRILAHRWTPDQHPSTPPRSAPRLRALSGSGGANLQWITPTSGFISGYRVERSAAPDGGWTLAGTPAFSSWTDAQAPRGKALWYRVAAVNAVGTGPWSQPVPITVIAPVATFVREDAQTQGDWQGVYGSLASYIDGDTGAGNPKHPDWLRFNGGTLRRFAGHASQPAQEPWYPVLSAPGSQQRTQPFAGSLYQVKSQQWVFELLDGQTRALSLYFAGHANGHGQTIEIVDPDTGAVLDTRHTSARGQGQGRYLTWNVAGRILVRITKDEKAFACPLAAIFFDAAR